MAKQKQDSLKDLGFKFKETRSEKVFTELYNRIRPGLYNYIFQVVKNQLRNLVSKLPDEYRVVIEEKFFNDLKYEEIAQKLDIPLHTVKNRISRGKRLIKEKYVA